MDCTKSVSQMARQGWVAEVNMGEVYSHRASQSARPSKCLLAVFLDHRIESKSSTTTHIHGLPFEYLRKAVAEDLGAYAGAVLHVDLEARLIPYGDYIRVCITFQPAEPLVAGIYLNLDDNSAVWIQFKYERAFKICIYCGRVGHSSNHCGLSDENVADDRGVSCCFHDIQGKVLNHGLAWLAYNLQGLRSRHAKEGFYSDFALPNSLSCVTIYELRLPARYPLLSCIEPIGLIRSTSCDPHVQILPDNDPQTSSSQPIGSAHEQHRGLLRSSWKDLTHIPAVRPI
ncbi:hypothetical protein L1049_026792 [Liquidambar formosana]|uniref:Zinc knuckle CX2CX4HX4C domain-containing protein n=1 Tax=Liquidambar formosana TaxID=63359 RepID=A0AAP0NDB2_LIQFO